MTQKEEPRDLEDLIKMDMSAGQARESINYIQKHYISKDEILKAIKQLNDGDWRKPINSDDLRQKLEALGMEE